MHLNFRFVYYQSQLIVASSKFSPVTSAISETFARMSPSISMKFVIVVLVSFILNTEAFQSFAQRVRASKSSTILQAARDSVQPVSIQNNAKVFAAAALPFFATLLTSGLMARAAVETTAEFKDEEKKVAEFKAQQQKIRKSWDDIIVKLEASDNPVTTESCIRDLTAVLVKYNAGIPSGVKKLELVKMIRSKKYVMVGKKQKILPTWSKDSEIAYQVENYFVNY